MIQLRALSYLNWRLIRRSIQLEKQERQRLQLFRRKSLKELPPFSCIDPGRLLLSTESPLSGHTTTTTTCAIHPDRGSSRSMKIA
jgi:hypothetical protein